MADEHEMSPRMKRLKELARLASEIGNGPPMERVAVPNPNGGGFIMVTRPVAGGKTRSSRIKANLPSPLPAAGTKYLHYKNNRYVLIAHALSAADGQTQLVVYQAEKTGQVWVRNAEEFFETVVLPDGRVVSRFALIAEE